MSEKHEFSKSDKAMIDCTRLIPATVLDLGSGPNPKNPFGSPKVWGVDRETFGQENILVCDLGFEPLPVETATVQYVSAFDLLEHIPRIGLKQNSNSIRNPFIFLMSEISRVLKKDGCFYAQTPAYPYPGAFSDPTHVNTITPDTIRYFATERLGDGNLIADDRLELGKRYGFTGSFVALRNYSDQQWGHQVWLLQRT